MGSDFDPATAKPVQENIEQRPAVEPSTVQVARTLAEHDFSGYGWLIAATILTTLLIRHAIRPKLAPWLALHRWRIGLLVAVLLLAWFFRFQTASGLGFVVIINRWTGQAWTIHGDIPHKLDWP